MPSELLLPSIALVGQTLRERSADAMEPINAVVICPVPKISQQKQKNINPSTSEQQAIEMLALHMIIKPIFEALFEDYSFG